MAVLQIEQRIRNTGRGSDFFGVCECCRSEVATTHVREVRNKYQRSHGTTFWSYWSQRQYGHLKCVRQHMVFDAPAEHAVGDVSCAPAIDDEE